MACPSEKTTEREKVNGGGGGILTFSVRLLYVSFKKDQMKAVLKNSGRSSEERMSLG